MPREFHTIAVDDGIAMGHGGMLYSLPSREVIADAVEYMVNGHAADALVCISNCDKITPGMLNAAMRLNIPTVFVSGGPMEAGKAVVVDGVAHAPTDLITAISASASQQVDDEGLDRGRALRLPDLRLVLGHVHRQLDELPHRGARAGAARQRLDAGHPRRAPRAVPAGRAPRSWSWPSRWYGDDDASALPRNIATRAAFENAMALDVAMGGSTNTVLHILAAAQEGEIDFDLAAIDAVSRRVPCLAKVAPNSDFHMEDVHRAGGIPAILGELWRAGLLQHRRAHRALPLARGVARRVGRPRRGTVGRRPSSCSTPRRAACARPRRSPRRTAGPRSTPTPPRAASTTSSTPTPVEGGLAVLRGNIAPDGA